VSMIVGCTAPVNRSAGPCEVTGSIFFIYSIVVFIQCSDQLFI
jgi:hypothetical protein